MIKIHDTTGLTNKFNRINSTPKLVGHLSRYRIVDYFSTSRNLTRYNYEWLHSITKAMAVRVVYVYC